jgi:CRP-like cAMP-binding protein
VSRHIDSKTARIQAQQFFCEADNRALEHLSSAVDIAEVRPGVALIIEKSLYHEAYIVESGTAEVTIGDTVVAEIGPGEMIGELGLFDPGTATATVRAKTAMSLLVIPYNRFGQILDDNPNLGRQIAKVLAQRLRATDARLH